MLQGWKPCPSTGEDCLKDGAHQSDLRCWICWEYRTASGIAKSSRAVAGAHLVLSFVSHLEPPDTPQDGQPRSDRHNDANSGTLRRRGVLVSGRCYSSEASRGLYSDKPRKRTIC